MKNLKKMSRRQFCIFTPAFLAFLPGLVHSAAIKNSVQENQLRMLAEKQILEASLDNPNLGYRQIYKMLKPNNALVSKRLTRTVRTRFNIKAIKITS